MQSESQGEDPDINPAKTGMVSEENVRKLVLDNDDLRFECVRLTASLEKAQREILNLTERNTALQHRLERIWRFAPPGGMRLLAVVRSVLGRR